jgi:chromo domain-containing protein 1
VFEEQPQLALQIVKLFLAKIDGLYKATGLVSPWQDISDLNLCWRVCVRPELMEYLFERCEEQIEALEAGDPNANARAELYQLLSDPKLIEQDAPGQASDTKPDKFPIISERREFANEEPLDYFNALARSREKANLRMVRYYGGLHIDMRRAYRHFYIVHTDVSGACALQWKREIQTLTDVITPQQCVVGLKRRGDHKGQNRMFDFHEENMSRLVE